MIVPDRQQTKPQHDYMTSRHSEATTVYHLAKSSGKVLQAGAVGVARTSMGFSHHSIVGVEVQVISNHLSFVPYTFGVKFRRA